MNPRTPKAPPARDLCPVPASSQGTDEQDKGRQSNALPRSPFPHCSSWGKRHPWAPVCSCNSSQWKEALGFTPQRCNTNARGLSNTELSSAVGTSAKAAGTTSDLCAKANRFWWSEKVQVGTETFPRVGACTRILFPVESAAVCLSSYPEILMENPTGSFHPFAYFSKLAGTQKLLWALCYRVERKQKDDNCWGMTERWYPHLVFLGYQTRTGALTLVALPFSSFLSNLFLQSKNLFSSAGSQAWSHASDCKNSDLEISA